jgi:hypothetical protein
MLFNENFENPFELMKNVQELTNIHVNNMKQVDSVIKQTNFLERWPSRRKLIGRSFCLHGSSIFRTKLDR